MKKLILFVIGITLSMVHGAVAVAESANTHLYNINEELNYIIHYIDSMPEKDRKDTLIRFDLIKQDLELIRNGINIELQEKMAFPDDRTVNGRY